MEKSFETKKDQLYWKYSYKIPLHEQKQNLFITHLAIF